MNVTPPPKPKMIEATQFTMDEYAKAKTTGFAISNEFKKSGMQMLAEREKDPKSELNRTQGGVKNVRRVRVLKNGSVMGDESWLPKNLSLVLDLLSAAQNKPLERPVEPPKPPVFHMFLEITSRVSDFVKNLEERFVAASFPQELIVNLFVGQEFVNQAVRVTGTASQSLFLKARQEFRTIIKAMVLPNQDPTDEQLQIFSFLDYLQSLMVVCSVEGAIGPERFAELGNAVAKAMPKNRGPFVKDQRRPVSNGKGPSKPQNRPAVQVKPQTPPQS